MPKTTRGLFSAWRDRMKKIILGIFIICGLQLPALAATYNCEVQEISALSWKRSNEFLFPTRGDYNDANGLAYVCGHRGTDGCDSGTGILIFGEHYWENNRYDTMEAYQCSTGGANAWVQQPVSYIPTCTNTNGMTKVYTQGDYDYYCVKYVKLHTDNARCIGSLRDSNSICRKPHQDQPTQPAQPVDNTINVCKTTLGDLSINASRNGVTKDVCNANMANVSDDHGTEFTMTCNANLTLTCEATKCEDGYTLNPSTGKCTKNNNNGGGGGGTGPNQCEQRRCAKLSGDVRNKCIACCHVLSDIAKWNSNTNTCICTQNASYLFVPNSDPKTGGFCLPQFGNTPPPTPEPEPDPEPAYKCDPEIMAQLMTWQAQYASSTTISGKILAIIRYCKNDPNENEFLYMYSQLVALINQENAAAQLTQQQNASRRRIEGAISDIDSVVSTLDRSKWKNAEGGFNTSRLLSDSIAGVVLGTAGGLITSHVVKKNQVEGGFEDIQCTVGGQVVSGWGDEFQVGIQ